VLVGSSSHSSALQTYMAAVLSDDDVSRDPALAALLACDGELVSIGRRIRVLKASDWPVAPRSLRPATLCRLRG